MTPLNPNTKILELWFCSKKQTNLSSIILKQFRPVYTMYTYTGFIYLTAAGNTRDLTTKTTLKYFAEQGR